HLSAFKTTTARITTTGLLPLVSGTCSLPELRAHSAANANVLLTRALGGTQIGKTIRARSLVRFVGFRFAGLRFVSHELLHHFHEMAHLVDHAANRRSILALHGLLHTSKPEAANRRAHIVSATDETHYPF